MDLLRTTHDEEITRIRARYDKFEEESEKKISDLKVELSSREEMIAELKEEMADTAADNTSLTEQLQTRTQALHALQSEHHVMLKTEDELRGELIKAQLELQSAINKGAIESNDINSLKAAQKDLQDTVGHKENLISSLQLQMKKLEEAFNEEKDNLQQSVYITSAGNMRAK